VSVLLPDHREREFGAGQDYVRTSGGIYVPPYSEAAATPPALPIGIDLFAGAGGFSCGFHMAGWHVIAASEWWPVAVQTYLLNLGSTDTSVYVGKTAAPDATKREQRLFEARGGQFISAAEFFELLSLPPAQRVDEFPSTPGAGWISGQPDCQPCEVLFCCDVHELTGDFIRDSVGLEVGDLGCVFGGPPCQGFSRGNRARDPGDGRNQLVFEFARLVCELEPQAFVMENVPGIIDMVTPEGIPVIDALSTILERGGMGEYEALRRSLLSTAGLGAAIKGANKPRRKKAADQALDEFEDETTDEEQLTFEVVA
jgi:DNA (cytosine-5)-methyltransferase 1